MNTEEAVRLTARYKNIWRGGPAAEELTTQFGEMDAGTIGTALVRLARDHEHPPSIAGLWRAYRELATPHNQPLEIVCTSCDNTGWVNAPTVTRIVHGAPHEYRQAQPCRACRHGQRAAQVNMSRSW